MNYKYYLFFKAKGTLAVHSSMAALFNSLGHGLLVFLTRGFVEYAKTLCRLYCVPKKIFIWG
jgi:hypothetical protein